MTSTGGVARIYEKPAQNCMYRMRLELERRDNAEVPTSSAESPEKVLVFRRIRREHSAVSGDHLARKQIVDRHAVLTKQPADTAAQCEAPNAGLRHDAARDRKSEDVRFAIQITQSRAALHLNGLKLPNRHGPTACEKGR